MSKWKTVRLGEVGVIVTGNTPPTSCVEYYENEDIPFYKPNDLCEASVLALENATTFVDNRAKTKLRLLPRHSVLVTCIGIIGKVGITQNKISATNQQINAIIPNADVSSEYIAYAISAKQKVLQDMANAPVVPIINKKDFSSIRVSLPPLVEQKKIAAELDKISGLIAKRKSQIEKLDLLVKAKFVEMFGDPVTNPLDWKRCVLSKFIIFLTSGSRGWSQFFSKEGEMFLTIKNVKNSRISVENMQYVHAPATKEAERTQVQTDDLLISITADLGRTGVVTNDIAVHGAYINQHLSLVRLNKECVDPLYISYYLESTAGRMQFDSKNQSAVKAGLNFDSIKSLEILVPPLPLQSQFADFVQKTEQTKATMQKSLVGLETLYKARMQEYFE